MYACWRSSDNAAGVGDIEQCLYHSVDMSVLLRHDRLARTDRSSDQILRARTCSFSPVTCRKRPRPRSLSDVGIVRAEEKDGLSETLGLNEFDAIGQPEQEPEDNREDSVLPNSLSDALLQAGEATSLAVQKGASRCLVEIVLSEFWDASSGAVFSEEGDQQRFWKISRKFVDSLSEALPGQQIKIVYPDTGVAAMLKNSWTDSPHSIASLLDRKPVAEEDDVIVIAAPDPLGLEKCKQITADLEDIRPVILFNPRLASGDVGVGLNVRRMRSQFLSTFNTTYCLRPIGEIGSVFRRYPDQYKVFIEDSQSPGRYMLAAEQPSRPAGEPLDEIIFAALEKQRRAQGLDGPESEGSGGKSIFGRISGTVKSLQRFAKQLQQ